MSFEVKKYLEPNVGTVMLQTSFDICNVARGTIGNFFVKILLKDQEKYSNYRYECPKQKGFYYWYNFPIPLDTILPSFVPKFYVLWDLTVRSKGKTAKSGIKPMSVATFRGETIRDQL